MNYQDKKPKDFASTTTMPTNDIYAIDLFCKLPDEAQEFLIDLIKSLLSEK